MKVGFVTFEKADNRRYNSTGSSRIRARWVAKYWDEAEEWKLGKNYDVWIFQKVYWEEMMAQVDGIKILDMCDPDWYERKDVMKYVDMADAVTTSTHALADYIKRYFPNKIIRCIPDRVDLEEHKPIKTEHAEKITSAVWFGYAHNFRYLEDALSHLMERDIAFTMIADTGIKLGLPHKKLKFEFKQYNYEKIHSMLIQHDVCILPMRRPDYRGQFKSNNKVLTSWALGLPVIEYPKDFDRLATKQARETEAKDKLNEVAEKWDVRQSVDEYKKLIDDIKNA